MVWAEWIIKVRLQYMSENDLRNRVVGWFDITDPREFLEAISHVGKKDAAKVPFEGFGIRVKDLLLDGKITQEQADEALAHLDLIRPKT